MIIYKKLPTECLFLISDFTIGDPRFLFKKVIQQLNDLSLQFTTKKYTSNIIISFRQSRKEISINWNNLWYTFIYKKYFTQNISRKMKQNRLSLFSIPKIFINFECINSK